MMKNRSKKFLIGVTVIAVLGIGAGFGYRYYQTPSKTRFTPAESRTEKPSIPYVLSEPKPAQEATQGIDQTQGLPTIGEAPPTPLTTADLLPDLNQSDGFARKMLQDLSVNAKWTDWLKIQNIIGVITASVDNIAMGLSPRSHLGFLSPVKPFSVKVKKGKILLDPQNYHRYDLVAKVFVSLDTAGTVKVWQALRPLFQQAFRELGYPDRDFQDTLIEAMINLLATPVVEKDIILIDSEKGINYLMVDEVLEKLNPAQKHLLRMGPENTLKIQKKLREIALGLGVPDQQLPNRRNIITVPTLNFERGLGE